MIDVANQGAAADGRGAGGGIDDHVVHRRQVGDHPVVDASKPASVVTAPTDREIEPVVARVVHGRDHVCCVPAARDQRGPLVDHRVVELARLVVGRMLRRQQLVVELLTQAGELFRYCHVVHGFLPCKQIGRLTD